jgi:hypothetical protein
LTTLIYYFGTSIKDLKEGAMPESFSASFVLFDSAMQKV